jgi:two-component system, cell cycle response regulator
MARRDGPNVPTSLIDEDDGDDAEQTVIAQVPVQGALGATKQRHAYLIVLAGANIGAVYRIHAKETFVGRSQKCEIAIGENGISRRHAKLTMLGDSEILLQDLGSTNGTFVAEQQVSSMVLKDGDRFQLGGTTLLKFSISDEVEESFQRRLYESSVKDGLTGLHNRKHFDERLDAEFGFALRHGSALSLILVDIDHFKRVNDTYGHQAGDEVLRVVARTLEANIRTEDVVARYGGEEFAVVARGISADQAVMFASRMRSLVEALPIIVENTAINLTISAGVATYINGVFSDKEELVAATDRALYGAKETGRNRVILAEECR